MSSIEPALQSNLYLGRGGEPFAVDLSANGGCGRPDGPFNPILSFAFP